VELARGAEGAVDFIGRDMHNALDSGAAGAVQNVLRTQYVGNDKGRGVIDGAVHMALRRKVHHSVESVLRKQTRDQFAVADVTMHKGVRASIAGGFRLGLQCAQVA